MSLARRTIQIQEILPGGRICLIRQRIISRFLFDFQHGNCGIAAMICSRFANVRRYQRFLLALDSLRKSKPRRPGPSGIAAMQALIGSEADGYTLGLATMNQVIFDSYLFASLPYDPRMNRRRIKRSA